MLLTLRFSFSTSRNYINQFKVRSRLADFFKHIHPDQMAQAPTKIKQQNLRSLKNFNSYLDAINQEKPIEGKLLKFYISQKTNNKSRKFFSFNLELPQLNTQQVQLDQKKAEKLIDDIVIALNTKYKESRGLLEGKKKEKIVLQPQVKIETEEQRISRLQQTVGPFQSNFKRYIEEQSLKKAINAKFMQAEREQLKLKLRKNMAFANTPTNKPMMWSRLLSEDSGIYSDYQEILNHLIDPKLIYFSEDINLHEIEVFKKKLLPGELDRLGVRATQAVLQVCEQMESYNPPICLYVTTHYSASEIPGFFSVPFDFRPTELLQNFKRCKNLIVQQRQKYQLLYDDFQQATKKLLSENRLKVKQLSFKNNQDISSKLIALKRLQKLISPTIIQIHFLEKEDFRIFCHQYHLDQSKSTHLFNGKIFTLTAFRQEDMNEAFEGRNQIVI